MSNKSLTLNQASQATGVSIVTLRRRIAEGVLVPEPRKSEKAPIRLTIKALTAAGLVVQDEPATTQGAVIDQLKTRAETAEKALAVAEVTIASLEGEIRGRREVEEMLAGQIRAALEQASKASLEQSRLVIDQSPPSRFWRRTGRVQGR